MAQAFHPPVFGETGEAAPQSLKKKSPRAADNGSGAEGKETRVSYNIQQIKLASN